MRSTRRHSLLWSCALLLAQGCIVQGTPMLSMRAHEHSQDRASWAGQLSVARDEGLHVGLEAEARGEHRAGSSFGGGLQLGYTLGNDRSSVRAGMHGDLGLALGWSAQSAWFTGATLELPIRLQVPPPPAERNRNFRIVGSGAWLVPLLRYRFYDLHTRDDVHELSVGLGLRMSYTSDLL